MQNQTVFAFESEALRAAVRRDVTELAGMSERREVGCNAAAPPHREPFAGNVDCGRGVATRSDTHARLAIVTNLRNTCRMGAEIDTRHLSTRLQQLEERVSGLEARDRANECSAHPSARRDESSDPDRFWALKGLKSRISDTSAVLFTGSVTLARDARYEWQQDVDVKALLEMDWSVVSDVLTALGQPVRLAILQQVLSGVQTVAQLGAVEGFGTSGQLYHHLRQLVAAGWLRTAGRGHYEVPPARVVSLLVVLAAAQR